MDEVRELLAEHEAGGMGVSRQLLLLRALRKTRFRRPDATLAAGQSVLARNAASDEETWNIHEQVLVAALDLGSLQVAAEHLQKLQGRFPGSSRVKRLQGMTEEANGNFDEAKRLYDELLEENPANLLVIKRKVSILKAQGNTLGAIQALNDLIKTFQCDESSWLELAEMYVAVRDFASAAFCYEELVILQPSNHISHTRLAEIYYTLGGIDNMIKARRHYTQSLDIQRQHNLRALLGLHAVCETLLAQPQSGKHGLEGKQREITEKLLELAVEDTRPDASVRSGMPRSLAETVAAALSS